DFDHGIFDGAARVVENLAGQVRDLADGRRRRVADLDQIVVLIQREPRRVERAFRQSRGAGQLFGKQAGDRETSPAQRQAAEKCATIGKREIMSHGITSRQDVSSVLVEKRVGRAAYRAKNASDEKAPGGNNSIAYLKPR